MMFMRVQKIKFYGWIERSWRCVLRGPSYAIEQDEHSVGSSAPVGLFTSSKCQIPCDVIWGYYNKPMVVLSAISGFVFAYLIIFIFSSLCLSFFPQLFFIRFISFAFNDLIPVKTFLILFSFPFFSIDSFQASDTHPLLQERKNRFCSVF